VSSVNKERAPGELAPGALYDYLLLVTAGSSLAAAAARAAAATRADYARRRCHNAHRNLYDGAGYRAGLLDRPTEQTIAARAAARAFRAAGAVGARRCGLGSYRRSGSSGLHEHALRFAGIASKRNGRNERKDHSGKTRLHVNLLELPNTYYRTRGNNLLSDTLCIAEQYFVATPKPKKESGAFC
jgi:hypothetical protein